MIELDWRATTVDGLDAYAAGPYLVAYEIDDGNAWWVAYCDGDPLGYYETEQLAMRRCIKDVEQLERR